MTAAAIPAKTYRTMRRITPVLNILSAKARARIALPDVGALTAGAQYTVTASALYLRSGPSTSATQIALMPNGATVIAAGGSENGFAEVSWNGKSGWAAEQYLQAVGGGVTGPDLAAGDYYVKTHDGSGVNLRALPSTQSTIVTGLTEGTRVHVVGANQNGFAQVDQPSLGWVASQFLSATKPVQGVQVGVGDTLDTTTLQLRTMLATWAASTGYSDFGAPGDFFPTPEAKQRETEAIIAFQKQTGLPETGTADDATVARLRAYVAELQQAGTATTPTIPTTALPQSKPLPQLPPTPTVVTTTTEDRTARTATGAGLGILVVIAVIGAFWIGAK